jgi:hypothetical protein
MSALCAMKLFTCTKNIQARLLNDFLTDTEPYVNTISYCASHAIVIYTLINDLDLSYDSVVAMY